MRGTSVSCTILAFANWRLRFADLHWSKWRRLAAVRFTFPEAVSLNRLATDLRVLLRAMAFGMGKGVEN